MRKSAIGTILVFACGIYTAAASDADNRSIAEVFATRAPKEITASGIRPAQHEVARVYLEPTIEPNEEANRDLEDCRPVETATVRNIIRAVAAEEGLDASFAEAVAAVESAGGASPGLSSAGAAGVMQLMPATAKELGVKDRCDTEANIRGGIQYLKTLLTEFDGDPVLALSAYNAGPTRVYKSNGIPLNNETVKYIAKVLNHWKYSAFLDKKKPRAAEISRGEIASEDNTAENIWRDGHVIDF